MGALNQRLFKRRLKYLPEDVLAAKVGHFDEAVLHRVRVLTLDLCGQTVQKKISIQNPTSDVMLMLGGEAGELLRELRSAHAPLTPGYALGQD